MRRPRISLEFDTIDQFSIMEMDILILQCRAKNISTFWVVKAERQFSSEDVFALYKITETLYKITETPITRNDAVAMIIAEIHRQHDEIQAYRKQREEEQERKAKENI